VEITALSLITLECRRCAHFTFDHACLNGNRRAVIIYALRIELAGAFKNHMYSSLKSEKILGQKGNHFEENQQKIEENR
jgi:hypothetical protein